MVTRTRRLALSVSEGYYEKLERWAEITGDAPATAANYLLKKGLNSEEVNNALHKKDPEMAALQVIGSIARNEKPEKEALVLLARELEIPFEKLEAIANKLIPPPPIDFSEDKAEEECECGK